MSQATQTRFTRTLAELRRDDEPVFGGKSSSLGELLAADIRVPPGFAISTQALDAFLSDAGLAGAVSDALGKARPNDVSSVENAAREIAQVMRSASLPGAMREEIACRYDQLGESAGRAQPPVAVRSSAVGEDSAEATFAGQQETYLWIRGVEALCDAVRDCWISLYSPAAISYRARLPQAAEPAMGVTVQVMVDAEISGVMFTCNPVSGDPSMIAINAAWGLGLAVVGGEVTPDDYLISKVTREVVREQVATKDVQYVPEPEGRGTVRVEVEPERRDKACLDDRLRAALVDVGRRVEDYFGSHQDVEWALARQAAPPEGLFVVQSRPVTGARASAGAKAPPTDAISMVMGKFGVQPRSAED